jgi:Tfp pilus assembly protein FimT
MLLVLALLGTAGAIVAPAVPSLRRHAAADEVSRVTSVLQGLLAQARLTALERATTVQLVLDPVNSRVWVFSVGHDEVRLLAESTLVRSPNVVLEANALRVRFAFDASGTASGGTILVRDSRQTRQITVDPWSGASHYDAR